MSAIQNAANIPINQQTGTIPNMNDALRNWFQPMVFVHLKKRTVNFQLEEFECSVSFHGVIQPLKGRDLYLKPEGQRAWTWLELYSDPSLVLSVDDIVKYNGIKTRVMSRTNYDIYGYVRYELVQDWNNCNEGCQQ